MAVLNTNSRYLHDNLARFAEQLTAKCPAPLSVCFIVNSGSEANDLALRMARQTTNRYDMIVVDGAYHGHLTSLIEISPYKFAGKGGAGRPRHTQVVPVPDLYQGVYRYGDKDAAAHYAADVDEAIEAIRREGREPAGYIAESLLSCGGQIVLPDGYLAGVYRRVRAAGGVCIADEVQVGFGRVGTHFWGFETQGVTPDIVTMGKPIGNGFPLAAVVTTPRIADAFANGMEYFNTYGGNPVACAAGLAVLGVMAEEGLQANALETGNYLQAGLERLKEKHPVIGDVRGKGLFIGIELVTDRRTQGRGTPQAAYIAERMREEGILVSTDGPFKNVIKIKPPICFAKQEANLFLQTLEKILAEDPLFSFP
jgi:4-aminobutyrate aminotransferase-like enzyme